MAKKSAKSEDKYEEVDVSDYVTQESYDALIENHNKTVESLMQVNQEQNEALAELQERCRLFEESLEMVASSTGDGSTTAIPVAGVDPDQLFDNCLGHAMGICFQGRIDPSNENHVNDAVNRTLIFAEAMHQGICKRFKVE